VHAPFGKGPKEKGQQWHLAGGLLHYQRSPERHGERNGYRDRNWDTRVGTLELRVPRVRDGSFFPSLLEPRKRAERALVATVREAYVQGVSTRRVDELRAANSASLCGRYSRCWPSPLS